jgi:toxin ParE1/3/4
VRYQFHPSAEAEYLETIAYYETQQPGLGASYISEFEALMERISESPNNYPIEHKPDIRRARFRRFPFAVLFRESDGIVHVLAVAHQHRRPSYWIGRV